MAFIAVDLPAPVRRDNDVNADTGMIVPVTVDTRQRLLRSLSCDAFRTGEDMGSSLGLSRAAVHKHVQALVDRGVPIHRVPGRGYRLADGVVLLDGGIIRDRLSGPARSLTQRIEVLDEVDSTSAHLARQPEAPLGGARVCLAEKQVAGRGRRGRSWIATPYRDLMMSVGIEYPQWPAQLQTLGLVSGLMVIRAVEDLGVPGLMLKWPNDVVNDDRKLCGLLLDVTGEAHGACRVIVGIGLNVSMGGAQGRAIDRHWVDLEAVAGRALDRNVVAAACLDALLPALQRFPETGFDVYRPDWRRRDALGGRVVTVHGAHGATEQGRADGVDDTGRLRVVDDAGGVRLFTQGEVSVRPR